MFESDDFAYSKAKKLGIKAYHAALQRGEDPYLAVLDEIVPDQLSLSHVNLRLLTIPMERIAGTGTRGRTSAFACNFMPLLEPNSEFAIKWMNLYHSVTKSGVRSPIKVLEYMNKYYVLEGNKRVSVAKFLGSPLIEAEVTRIIPKRTDELENRIYFEYLDFYRDTKINFLYFSDVGGFAQIYELVGKTPGEAWTAEEVADFRAVYLQFTEAFNLVGADLLNITPGDAFLIYLKIYGYEPGTYVPMSEMRERLNRLRGEMKAHATDESISLLLSTDGQKPGFIRQIISPQPQQLRVSFVHQKSPETSGWTYWHELGKNRVESVFEDNVKTSSVYDVEPEQCEDVISAQIENGANIVFTTSPVLLDGAIRAAIKHPEAKVLNCSLLPEYRTVRSYYLRMYEAKFIIGAIAGAVSDNDRIGYIADYPVYGAAASINAFALGARLTNPRAKVFLEWSTVKDSDPLAALAKNGVRVISNRDISAPSHQSMEFGLYLQDGDAPRNLAMPVWNWGRLYEDLLRRVQSGVWRTDGIQNDAQAMNYWWGMDVGAIDVFYSHKLDAGTRRLTDLMRHQVRAGALKPFAETIVSQDGQVRCSAGKALTPAEIIAMDYLADNVVGSIPTLEDMKPEAQPFVELQGIHSIKAPDASEICWTEPSNEGES